MAERLSPGSASLVIWGKECRPRLKVRVEWATVRKAVGNHMVPSKASVIVGCFLQ